MRYARIDKNGVVYAIEGEIEYDVVPENAIEISVEDDVEVGHVYDFKTGTFSKSADTYLVEFREQRDRLFMETQWVRERHKDRLEMGIDDTENWNEWLRYWQYLRDMPDQPDFDPQNPKWPNLPEQKNPKVLELMKILR